MCGAVCVGGLGAAAFLFAPQPGRIWLPQWCFLAEAATGALTNVLSASHPRARQCGYEWPWQQLCTRTTPKGHQYCPSGPPRRAGAHRSRVRPVSM